MKLMIDLNLLLDVFQKTSTPLQRLGPGSRFRFEKQLRMRRGPRNNYPALSGHQVCRPATSKRVDGLVVKKLHHRPGRPEHLFKSANVEFCRF